MVKTTVMVAPRSWTTWHALALVGALAGVPWVAIAHEASKSADPAGQEVFARNCAVCHEHGAAGAPSKTLLQQMPPGAIEGALTRGAMVAQGSKLTEDERHHVVAYLAGNAPLVPHHPLPKCDTPLWANHAAPQKTTAWGIDADNSRSLTPGDTRLSRADVGRLKLDWTFVFPDSLKVRSQPTVVGGTLFVGGQDGTVYALDADSGCVYWSYQAAAELRGAIVYASDSEPSGARLYLGDVFANVYSLDAQTGSLKWRIKADDHATARIVGTPVVSDDRIFVPVGSWGEEIAAVAPDFDCCTFRGSMLALDRRTGATLWKRYTIPQPATLQVGDVTEKKHYGPSGASIWSSPTYDKANDLLYFGTGDNFSEPGDDNSDAVFALKGRDGSLVWKKQVTAGDIYNDGCIGGKRNVNCPKHFGADIDFTASPILVHKGERNVLVAGQKSGDAYGFEPKTGELLWHVRLTTDPNPWRGGIWFGMVVQAQRLIVPVATLPSVSTPAALVGTPEQHFLSDPINGLRALDPFTGKFLWQATPDKGCRKGVCQSSTTAPLGIPGVVFTATVDGTVRAYDDRTGTTLWRFDTAQSFTARNGDSGKGGLLTGAGAFAVGEHRLFVTNANVLLAFSPEERAHEKR